MNDQPNSQNELNRVLEKIQEIVEKSVDGDYIYRGEPECYPKVSSNLYREYEKEIEDESFDIKVVQQEIVNEAREYISETANDIEILTELQHHGGKTKLIDFT
ncbi:MAG: FRG domain-containing protein, partial [Candidatus Poribacteria bacterium]|nr:FRG domain-containing protein [Candidatus Poribacteria bacterium]